jgi:hypothetical protein
MARFQVVVVSELRLEMLEYLFLVGNQMPKL